MYKKLLLILAVLLLVGGVSAGLTWIPHGYPTQYYTAQDGNDVVVKYNIPGTFGFILPTGITEYQYLVVAGGGGGSGFLIHSPIQSGDYSGGSGGAGGLLNGTQNLTGYTDPITIVVGGGGLGGGVGNTRANSGTNSTFNNITAIGGGYGGAGLTTYKDGSSGGSGGGGAADEYGSTYGSGGAGTGGQGYGGYAGASISPGAGGGAGGAATSDAGGAGVSNSISGSAVTYSVGGCNPIYQSYFPANPGDGGHSGLYSGGNTNGNDGIVYIRYNGTAPASNSTGASSYNQNLLYTPHLCRMYFTDEWGNRLSGLTINATPTGQTSVPASWLNIVLGIPVNASMPSTSLSGTSSTDGSITFLMVEVIQYSVVVSGTSPINGATIYQVVTFYPKDTDYTIKINTGLSPNLQAYPTYNLTDYLSTNETTINLTMNYTDTSGATTNLTFYVRKNNATMVSTQVIGGSGSAYFVINNTKGDSYTYGFNATNSLGTNGVIEGWKDVTPKGSGALFDFGLDMNTRMWIALAFIFLFTAMWGTTSVKQGAFLVPFFGAGIFWYIGWLPAALGTVIFIMSFIGALYYMRGQENKTVEA
jgi:hypothetical protein